jgi:site-specific DNA-methyltransferase (adenine-specific)
MSEKAAFTLKGRNPDILTCIANLSNDEVFTPPEFANRMLDTVAEAWAADHDGANIWADKTVRFLDPCTKSGVFLREITRRLAEGLADEIPDLQERVDHILTKQVFGIAITRLTAMLARRSVYCTKHAQGKHSIGQTFANDDGNIWWQRLEHSWVDGKCRFCGASSATLERGTELESYAYPFLHTDNPELLLGKFFGKNMNFNVIIGNPPYQLDMDAAGQNVAPIYHKFIAAAEMLEPELLCMVIPSRWMAGGQSVLEDFRKTMLADRRISVLVDYPVASEVFPGVEVKGGICYFLRELRHDGPALVTTVRGNLSAGPLARDLGEFDVFVRDPVAVVILKKVISLQEPRFSELVSARDPFGPALSSNFKAYRDKPAPDDIQLFLNRGTNRIVGWVQRDIVSKNQHLIDTWKVLAPKAGSDGGQRLPDAVMGKPIVARPPSACTLTYVAIGPFDSEYTAESVRSYYSTKFFRFLVSLRKITQDATRHVYSYVPQQTWDRRWTDGALYAKYGLTSDEVDYIEAVIKPMALQGEDE